jgi:hypothetical protein
MKKFLLGVGDYFESNRRWIEPSPALSGILSQRERHHSVRFYVSKKYRGFNENCPTVTFKW